MTTPQSIHIARGNPGKRKLKNDVFAPKDLPTMPAYFHDNPYAQMEWTRTTDAIRKMGIASSVDQQSIEALCVNYSIMRSALDKLNVEGLTITTDRGSDKASPYFQVYKQSNAHYIQLLREMCLTPVSRARARTEQPKANPLEKFRTTA
jgi:P27 family predicted phage terminase small subunit